MAGSIQVLLPEGTTLNGGAKVSGDLLVPGMPNVRLNGSPGYGGTIEAAGGEAPGNFTITINGNAQLRHVVRRVDPIGMATVAPPAQPSGTRNVHLNNAADTVGDFTTLRDLTLNGPIAAVAVPPGTYGRFTANGNNQLVFGVAGASEPAVYDLQTLTLNGTSRIQIVGPVVLTLAGSTNLNGSVGAADHPEWLTLRLATGGVTVNGNVKLYGHVVAPSGTVTVNGSTVLTGSVSSDRLVIQGNGLFDEAF